tara:strand:+ start:1625 stop:2617 length:993 start_codon:yes stop_codon:yes gene_type:complete
MKNCLAHTNNCFYNTDGGVYPCCQYDQNVPYTTTDSVWHPGCHRCHTQEQRGQHSLRQTLNEDLVDQVSVEIAVDNTCNLTCVMCSSFSSHGIAAREKQLYGRSAVPGRTSNRIDYRGIDFSTVTRLRLYGGEPLFSPGANNLILSVDPANMQIILPTNCTIIPNAAWQSFLKRAGSVIVDLSIDAWGDLNTYQRPGSDWATTVATLDWWYRSGYTCNINATVSVYNYNYVQQLKQKIAQHYPGIHLHTEYLVSPQYLDVHALPGIAALYGTTATQDLYRYFYTAHQFNGQLHSVNPQLSDYILAHPVETVSQKAMLELVMPSQPRSGTL